MNLKIKSRNEAETSVTYSIQVEKDDSYENYFEARLIVIICPEDEPLAETTGFLFRYKVPQLEEIESRETYSSFAEAYVEGLFRITQHAE